MRHLIPLSDVKFGLIVHETPAKESLYLKAGAPTRCNACRKRFEGFCIRGDDDRYYCSEVCAQVGLEIDFDKVANILSASGNSLGNSSTNAQKKRSVPIG